MEQNEQELIAQILDGNEDAYADLINRYKKGLYHHCFKFMRDEDEAEDVAHEAFIEAYVHLDRYNPQFRFSTWLYKIATNLALMRLRKRRDVRMDEDELDRIMSNLPGAEDLALHQELRDAVDALPMNYRTVVSMHYWHGKSYSEIAMHMGTSVGSIKGWMSRAKKQLKEVLS
ncbi:MAG TPA: sigma-70 family RNA polymerase sigma factor [Candidatus Saccharimonadales bacterium]|nr:sigma-70 family RNA polymerase sigma factor [Candidatus Saccharimonadales bacterium]